MVNNILVLCVLACVATFTAAYQQTVIVKGQLFCGSKGSSGAQSWVKVLNKRTGFDDQKEASVNSDGTFQVTLTVDRTFGLTPELHIYTDCNDETLWGSVQKGCQRKIVMKIPEKYVASGGQSTPYDIGRQNMESKFNDEERDCSARRSLGGGGGNSASNVKFSIACWLVVFVAALFKNF